MLTLVTGGSGSGKSAFAEDRVLSFGDAQRIYIATMHPFDEESHKRIERHQKMRAGKGFETVECYTGLKNVKLPAGCVVLLECMSNLVANEMFEEQGAHDRTVSEVTKGIENLLEQAAHVVIVTNEIFSDAVVFDGDMDSYLEYLGKINQEIAKKAEEMAKTVKQAIETYGTTHIWGLGDVYAYEVDGFGQYNLMDDANVPSLLAELSRLRAGKPGSG